MKACLALLVAAVAGLGPFAKAQERVLLAQSPFEGAPGASGAAGPPSQDLELRGIMATPAGVQYCIYDPGRKTSVWAFANESGNAFLVKSGRPAEDEVTLQEQGRLVTLRMREGKVIPAAPEPPAVQPVTAPPAAARRRPGEPRAPRENPSQ